MPQTPIMLKFFSVLKILFFLFSLILGILIIRGMYISSSINSILSFVFPAYLVFIGIFYGYIAGRVYIIFSQLQQPEKINRAFLLFLVLGLIIGIVLAGFYVMNGQNV